MNKNEELKNILTTIKNMLTDKKMELSKKNIYDTLYNMIFIVLKKEDYKKLEILLLLISRYESEFDHKTQTLLKCLFELKDKNNIVLNCLEILDIIYRRNMVDGEFLNILINFLFEQNYRKKSIKILKGVLKVEKNSTIFKKFYLKKINNKKEANVLLEAFVELPEVIRLNKDEHFILELYFKYTIERVVKVENFLNLIFKFIVNNFEDYKKCLNYIQKINVTNEKQAILQILSAIFNNIKNVEKNEDLDGLLIDVFCDKGLYNSLFLKELLISMKSHLNSSCSNIVDILIGNFTNDNSSIIIYQILLEIIGLENFIAKIIKIHGMLDLNIWICVLKSVSNSDISMFNYLYRNSNDIYKLWTMFPQICNFFTDKNNVVSDTLNLVKKDLLISDYQCYILRGISNYIDSNLENINNTIILRSKISKEESKRFLEVLKASDILEMLFALYLNNRNQETRDAIFKLLEISNLDYSKEYVDTVKKCNELNDSLYNSLDLLQFFIDRMDKDFEFTSKIIDICYSNELKFQKLGFKLLYLMIKNRKVDVCVCRYLFSNEDLKKCYSKYRVMCLYEIYFKGCEHCNSNDKWEKVILNLIIGLLENNEKYRKTCIYLCEKLMCSIEKEKYIKVINYFINYIKPDDLISTKAILKFLSITFPLRKEFISDEIILFIREKTFILSKKSKNYITSLSSLFEMLILNFNLSDDFIDEIIKTLDRFVSEYPSKKELKNVLKRIYKSKKINFNSKLRNFINRKRINKEDLECSMNRKNIIEIKKCNPEKKEKINDFTRHRPNIKNNKRHKN